VRGVGVREGSAGLGADLGLAVAFRL